MKPANSGVIAITGVLAAFVSTAGSEKTEISVRIVDRQIHDTVYTYVVPGQFTRQSNSIANCFGTGTTVNCSGRTTTTGTATPMYSGSFAVKGATLSLQLPDGRIAVVNCDSKFVERLAGPAGNHRSCRVPLVNDIRAEFDGDKAKLKWPVSIDRKKIESETYKILGVLDSGPIGPSSTHKAGPEDEPVIGSTGDALELANSAPATRTTTQATGQEAIATSPSPITLKTVAQSNVNPNGSAPGLKNVAEIIVTSDPAGAAVEINGYVVGTTPLTLRLVPNNLGLNLYVKKAGYRMWCIQTLATPGPQQIITADLQPEFPSVRLK